jgi:hypothetical protein
MHLQVRQLVLWPRNPKLSPRVVPFETGAVNVITGASKTGKSAVIPLIDYCLGSDRCTVPVRAIRDACSWFGVVVETSEGEKLLARREPGDQQSTGDMVLLEGERVEIPATIDSKNTTVDAVKRAMDRLAGLSNLGFDPGVVGGNFRGRPSFRDMMAFALQPQNIVANPDVLFFKADTMEHKEKLRTIFPYVLGAVTPGLLAKRWEADQLMRELRRKERELSAQVQATEEWRAQLRGWLEEARDLGLLTPDEVNAAGDEPTRIRALEGALTKTSADADVSGDALDAASAELGQLQAEETRVTLEMSSLKARLDHMTSLRSAVDEYTGALRKQRERLDLSRWLRDLSADRRQCPVCGGDFAGAHEELDALCDALANVEASARQLEPVPAAFDRELNEVRERVRRLTDQFRAVRVRRKALEERSERLRSTRWRASAIDRFLGRAEQAIKMFRAREQGTELSDEVSRLREELEQLRAAISEAGIAKRIESSLRRVSGFMARLLPELDIERPNDPADLNIEDLTIRVAGSGGRADYLWEIGSGANWLSYHVAALVGLQQLFLEQRDNPVPSFLVFDQPSQVYFPRSLARAPGEGFDPKLSDEDVMAVRKVFKVLGDATTDASGKLQVIVLDHAGGDVWSGVSGVHLVEEWRNGAALVPREWLA